MTKALHLPEGPGAHAAFGELLRGLQPAGRSKYELSIANALWGQQGFAFRDDFLTLTRQHYGAGLRTVDFQAPEPARQTINRWVEEQTRNKIKDLMPEGSIDAMTRLVLTNAIYFKGPWEEPFPKAATRPAPFQLGGGKTVQAPLMHVGGNFGYFESDTLQAVSLPYAGDSLSMVVLLPRKVDGLAELERALTPKALAGWLSGLARRDGDVMLPRFQMSSSFDLQAALEALGVRRAFHRGADFSGLTPSPEPLYISKVVHKAFVDVNEEGSEAAAATGVGISVLSAPVPRQRFTFRADHPFLILIRGSRTGSILFLGRVANPAG
jgi:serpin B